LHRGALGFSQGLPAEALSLLSPSGAEQIGGQLDQQPASARVSGIVQLQRRFQQLCRRGRAPPRDLPRGSRQPVGGLSVPAARTAQEVFGHERRFGAGRCEAASEIAMHAAANAGRHVTVERLAHQIVGERQLLTVLDQHPSVDRFAQWRQQRCRRTAAEKRQLRRGEGRAEHRRHSQDVQGVITEDAEAAQDGGIKRRRAGWVCHLDRAAFAGADQVLGLESLDQESHEQRVPAARCQLRAQVRARPPAGELRGDRHGGVGLQALQLDVLCRAFARDRNQPL
jgi:hypothetical protein